MRRTRYISILALVLAVVLAAAGVAWAAVPTNSAKPRTALTVGGIMEHEREFQPIADANKNRASGTSGLGPHAPDLRPDDLACQRHRQGLGHANGGLRVQGLAPAEVAQAALAAPAATTG